MTKFLAVLTAVAALAACNTSTEGAIGNIAFTPTDCGLVGCNLDDSIGVGGVIQMHIAGLAGISTAGASMVSDNPELLSVIVVPDVGGQPTWELQALAAGVPSVTVYGADETVLDFVEIPTQDLSGIISQNILGEAVGPSADATFNELWVVNANESVSFQVTPVIGIDVPVMGKYVYTATLDAVIDAGLLDDTVSDGYLYFNVPAGQYPVSFENDFGLRIDILLDVR